MSLISDRFMKQTIDTIRSRRNITLSQLGALLTTGDKEVVQYLYDTAHAETQRVYGDKIFMRGLIELTNHCKNDCYYCGIRRSRTDVHRYRLTRDEVLECCKTGYDLGFRTYVIQGGEDGWYDDEKLCDIVSAVRKGYPDCAITLSIGERSRESYQRLYDAGANRYLLRHETADATHYGRLHPADMSFDNRIRCLHDLREIGYQVGCGFMVGSPYQTVETLYKDLQFIRSFQPHMVGIGPFVPAADTPFADRPAGSVETTLRLLSIIRLLHPTVLLPATTALGTLHPRGRELGILAGANVVMPNLSPKDHRKDYSLYDNKLCTGDEAAECRVCLDRRIRTTGSHLVVDRGDYPACEN